LRRVGAPADRWSLIVPDFSGSAASIRSDRDTGIVASMGLRFALPLVWPLWAAAPAPVPAPASTPILRTSNAECRPEDRVELNVATWKAALRRAETRERQEELLGTMKLSLAPVESETPEIPDSYGSPSMPGTLLGIDDFFARLGTAEKPDHVIQIRFRLERPDDKGTTFLIQVLRPLGGTRWCALGSELSHRDDAEGRTATYTLAFVPLLGPQSRAIEVQIAVAELRRSAIYRQYWIAEGFRLRKIFDQKISSLDTVDAGGLTVSTTGKIQLLGSFPKRIEVSQIAKNATCDVAKAESPCDDSERASSMTFIYDGARYLPRK
jgi:hypothetical protein